MTRKKNDSSNGSLRSDALTKAYRELDRQELARQGAEHLTGRVDVRARQAVQIVRLAAWTVIIAALVLGGGFSGWLLTSKRSGQTFSEVRQQALHAYDETGD